MSVVIYVKCPYCKSEDVSKNGFTPKGNQRYRCNNSACKQSSFLLDYKKKGWRPEIKDKIINMALNGNGIRDTSRVLGVSPWLVINEIKKSLQYKKSKLEEIEKYNV